MKRDPFASLRIADFRFFVSARLFMTLATQMQAVIVGWQIYEHTKNPFWLGMIGLTEFIPFICTALFAGHIVDIIQRKKIIMVSSFAFLLCTALLWVFTFNKSAFLNEVGVWPVYGVIFVSGIARAFIAPAFFAFLSQIVPRSEYSNASTWNSTVWQIGAVGGPAVAGILYGLIGVMNTYAVDLVLLFMAFACFSFVKSKPLPPKQEKEPLFESLAKGIRFVFQTQEVLTALSLDLFAVFFGGAVAMLPVFADKILMIGPIGLGLLRAAPSVGAVIMAGILVLRPPLHNAGRNMLLAVTGFGICMILFAISTNVYISLLLLALSGAFDCVSVVIRSTILQLMTPDEMRGRVASVNNIFIGSSNELGEFESGMTAKLMGLVPSVIFGGCMTLVVIIYTAFKAKKLRGLHLDSKV